jgi:hypothetical protein
MLVYQRVENEKQEVQISDFLEQGQLWNPKTMDFRRTMYEIKDQPEMCGAQAKVEGRILI